MELESQVEQIHFEVAKKIHPNTAVCSARKFPDRRLKDSGLKIRLKASKKTLLMQRVTWFWRGSKRLTKFQHNVVWRDPLPQGEIAQTIGDSIWNWNWKCFSLQADQSIKRYPLAICFDAVWTDI